MIVILTLKQKDGSIGNPADNDCIFVIVLKLEDGTKLFESQELKPGEGLENITLDQELPKMSRRTIPKMRNIYKTKAQQMRKQEMRAKQQFGLRYGSSQCLYLVVE